MKRSPRTLTTRTRAVQRPTSNRTPATRKRKSRLRQIPTKKRKMKKVANNNLVKTVAEKRKNRPMTKKRNRRSVQLSTSNHTQPLLCLLLVHFPLHLPNKKILLLHTNCLVFQITFSLVLIDRLLL